MLRCLKTGGTRWPVTLTTSVTVRVHARWVTTRTSTSVSHTGPTPLLKKLQREPPRASSRRLAERHPLAALNPSQDNAAPTQEQQVVSSSSSTASALRSGTSARSTPLQTHPHTSDEAVYAHSMHKRLPSRRHVRDKLSSTTEDAGDVEPFDPALVVHVDSARRQLHLNSIQKELVWAARQKEYHSVLHRIVCCLQGHQSPIEKASTLLALHDVVVRKRLRLRVDTYEDILHLLYAVGVGGHVRASVKGHASATPSTDGRLDARLAEEVNGGNATTAPPLALPAEFATARAASSAVLSESSLTRIWAMYRYLVDSGTDPSPRVLQYVMGLLEHGALAHVGASHSSQHPLIEAKAHSLLIDADRFRLTPTEYTLNSYIGICDVFGVMHLAVARVTDYQTRHQRQATPGMYARLLTGLVRHGHHDEAMALVTTMNSVAMSIHLLNAVLQAARFSKDPMSVFSLYRAVLGGRRGTVSLTSGHGRLTPTVHTFSILLEVIVAEGEYGAPLSFVLREMQRYRVKGNSLLLNKILRALITVGRVDEATALATAMRNRHVQVFDELAAQLSTHCEHRV